MRFMMLMIPKGYEKAQPGAMPDAKSVEAMMQYNNKLREAGVLLSLDGLQPPSKGARVTFSSDGKTLVSKGPFAETTETLGGYWMIKADTIEEAIEWAKCCPAQDAVIEIRQVQEFEDFPEDVQKVLEGFREMQHR